MAEINEDMLDEAIKDGLLDLSRSIELRPYVALAKSVLVCRSFLLNVQIGQGLSPEQLAARMGCHTNTVKIYGRYLESRNLISVEVLPTQGGPILYWPFDAL